ncbi:isocitrate lyase/phosphoenolpyruvate mutase family protein [Ideonella sp. DXS29W]|uniref:Isocitrate lyase/phosphoenolpyruvate mutase family protein n=1 Tax=Ideonella lacteola TaxID=2984193 RepID=A0ABU9BK80_9BURK
MSMTTVADKAALFRQLHARSGVFVMPNPWDAGSAKLLAGLGFEALATSSAASAMSMGRTDYQLTLDDALAHARAIVEATDLPVSADLENGFGHAPEVVAQTIRLAGEVGLAGGSIEDASQQAGEPIYPLSQAAERVAAAVEAARSMGRPFTLTARAENFLNGRPDLDDTIRRLQAFEAAGADVLFAPGLPSLDAVKTVCSAVAKPVSFMVGIPGKSFSVAELEAAGVKRISLATSLYRAAMNGLKAAAEEIRRDGTFGYLSLR